MFNSMNRISPGRIKAILLACISVAAVSGILLAVP